MSQGVVLYIEDNAHNRRIVRKILNSRGYDLLEAEDGLSGLTMAQSHKPPLILLDIGLPGMDGMQVIAAIRADESINQTPVIALTASAMRGDRERFLEAGCDDYLSKPIRVIELIKMVEKHYPTEAQPEPSSVETN